MNKELARYFVKLISEDLQFSFNGIGIPSYTCEWLENKLIQENYDKVKEFIQEMYDEHYNTRKKKRKFRAMNIGEHCARTRPRCENCEYFQSLEHCDYSKFNEVQDGKEPYKTKDGKYILIEVKE